jgi:hypothetical protein
MRQYIAIILLIFLIIVIYLITAGSISQYEKTREKFVALSGIESPLTTYDGYGTFNFLFNFDDLPYYDPTFENLEYELKDYDPKGQEKPCGSINDGQPVNVDYDHDSFIEYDNHKVRRELVPSNYTKYNYAAPADFGRMHFIVKKDRPQASAYAPEPYNYYFKKISL